MWRHSSGNHVDHIQVIASLLQGIISSRRTGSKVTHNNVPTIHFLHLALNALNVSVKVGSFAIRDPFKQHGLNLTLNVRGPSYLGLSRSISLRRQGICYVEYVLVLLEEGFLSTCVRSIWSNDIKCKYMFVFPLHNLARKELTCAVPLWSIVSYLYLQHWSASGCRADAWNLVWSSF